MIVLLNAWSTPSPKKPLPMALLAIGSMLESEVDYTIVDGTTRQDVEEAYGPLPGLPSSFVIARNGSVCYTHVGVPRPEGDEKLQDAIRRVFEAEIRSLL